MAWTMLKSFYVVGFLCTLVGLLSIFLTNTIIYKFVKSKVKLVPTTEIYQNWLTLPIDLYMTFYVFNLKNGPEFEKNGSKPIFEEIGPFVYREIRTREDMINNYNNTITFKERRILHFVPEKSAYDETYPITTINIIAMTAISYVKYKPGFEHPVVNLALKLAGETVLTTKPFNQLMFGYEDKLLEILSKLSTDIVPSGQISYFLNKNFTIDGEYTVYTGEDDFNKIGVIERFNRMNKLDIWTSDLANSINGTDFALMHPFLNESSNPYTFQSDVCRSFPTVFGGKSTTLRDIEIYGYTIEEFTLANATVNPYNSGFCVPAGNCLPAGIFNLSNCVQVGIFNAPVFMSLPHYLYGDPRLLDQVIGLKPNLTKHQTMIYFEPLTGVPMRGNKRVQVNTKVYKDEKIPVTDKLPDIFFPLYYIDENFEINMTLADKIYNMVKLPLHIFNGFKFAILGIGVFTLIICTAVISTQYYQKRRLLHSEINETTHLLN